jgi:hypothetical protein
MNYIRSNNASILKPAQLVRLMEKCYQNKYVEWIYTGVTSRAGPRMKRKKNIHTEGNINK